MNVYCVFNTVEINNKQVDVLQAIFSEESETEMKNHIREYPELNLHYELWNVQ